MAIKYKESTISLSNIRIRPYDSSSKIAHEFPGFEHFDNRNDFILFRHVNHVAVAFRASNLMYGGSSRPVREAFHINICDVTGGYVVTSKTISVRLQDSDEWEEVRCDVPLTESQICPEHDYRVVIYHPGSEKEMLSKDLRFFNPKKLPTKYFSPQYGCLRAGTEVDPYKALYGTRNAPFISVFVLENQTFSNHRYPQIEYRMINPGGGATQGFCDIEEWGDDMLEVSANLSFGESYDGTFYVELLCMGYPFTGMVFSSAGLAEEGRFSQEELGCIKDYVVADGDNIIDKRAKDKAEKDAAERRKSIASDFDNMVGLENVKSKVKSYAKLMKFNKCRAELGLPVVGTSLHAMFLGSPGTGKTTVAKIMGELLRDSGVLSSGHVVVRERANLLGQYYNSESENTLAALEEARGGILFIDEAHQLHQPNDPRDPGRFVLETLMSVLADESRRDWMLILAGYSAPMMKMFELSPGLASRIPSSNLYYFDDYSVEELKEIAERFFVKNEYELSEEARIKLDCLLEHDYNNRDEAFGNARHVMNVIQNGIFPAMASRLADIAAPTRLDLSLILPEDIPTPVPTPIRFNHRIGFAV